MDDSGVAYGSEEAARLQLDLIRGINPGRYGGRLSLKSIDQPRKYVARWSQPLKMFNQFTLSTGTAFTCTRS